jgi:hypothetical protein
MVIYMGQAAPQSGGLGCLLGLMLLGTLAFILMNAGAL